MTRRSSWIVVVLLVFAAVAASDAQAQCSLVIRANPSNVAPGQVVGLSWDPPNAACTNPDQPTFAGYEVWAQPPAGAYAKVADVATGTRTYNYTTGGAGTYNFYVRAAYTNAVCGACIVTYAQSAPVSATASVPCSYSIAPTSAPSPAAGGAGSVTVTAGAGCAWTAASNASFITVTGGASGSGNGTVNYAVAANPTGSQARSGTVTIAGMTFTVNQAAGPPCSYSIAPTSAPSPAAGGAGSVTVTAAAGCAWTAASNSSFITITGGASGSGNGTVSYNVAANPTGSMARSGTLTIAGMTFTVNQDAGPVTPPPCTYSIAPTSSSPAAAGGPGTITVTAGTGCAWTAASNASFITVTGGAAGSGNGTVSYTVAANTGAARSGTLTVAGQTFTVNQGGVTPCSYSIAPTSASFATAGGGGSVTVTAGAGCAWFASSNVAFISVTSASGGSGNGTVTYTVSPNSGSARTGTMTIAGITFTVTQSGDCTYALTPDSTDVPGVGGDGSFTVNTSASCSWAAVSTDPFVIINTGRGTGTGVVTFTVASNGSTAREATITVGNSAFIIRQFANTSSGSNPRRRRAVRLTNP
jgi:hypothetical protein